LRSRALVILELLQCIYFQNTGFLPASAKYHPLVLQLTDRLELLRQAQEKDGNAGH